MSKQKRISFRVLAYEKVDNGHEIKRHLEFEEMVGWLGIKSVKLNCENKNFKDLKVEKIS